MCLLLGIMMTSAVRTNRASAARSERTKAIDGAITTDKKTQDELARLRKEVSRLGEENSKMQQAIAKETNQAEVLYESIRSLKQFAGLTVVEGPGVRITLTDSKKANNDMIEDSIIHDTDILKVANELWNAGAEAIAVNGNRVALGTNFRCVGSTILVDSVKVASPITIQAIGDSNSLKGALTMPGGIVNELSNVDPQMVQLIIVDKMTLPPFAGSTTRKYMKTVEEPK